MAKAIVIGSGMGGIASAIRLAVKGYQVDVFEANSYPGGKLTQIEKDGFRFDAGPSLFTMPELVDELYTLAGKNPKDYFKYRKLDEICRYFFEDGTQLNASADIAVFANEANLKTGVDKNHVTRHLRKSDFIYRSTFFLFMERSLHKVSSYLSLKVFFSFLKIPFLGLFVTMDASNKKRLKDPKMIQLFNRYATYNGSDPYRAPGILNIIPHLEFNKGAYFPKGGMHNITQCLYDLAISVGVHFHFNQLVDEVVVENSTTKGVLIDKVESLCDLIVCNMDVFFAYKKLLPNVQQPRKIVEQERSSSALIFYWGVRGSYASLGLHNVFFSNDYKKEFSYISKGTEIYNDPTIYVNISCKENTKDAPENSENWFVMINVPANNGQDWDELIKIARNNIIKKLNRGLKMDLEKSIVSESLLDPRSIESKTCSYQGSLYGTSSNTRMAAFFRHPNFSNKIKNLYFCGGSVHPGGGIPLALSSAKIIDGLIPKAN